MPIGRSAVEMRLANGELCAKGLCAKRGMRCVTISLLPGSWGSLGNTETYSLQTFRLRREEVAYVLVVEARRSLGFWFASSPYIISLLPFGNTEIQRLHCILVKKCLAIVIVIAYSSKNQAVGKLSNRLMIFRIMCAAPSVITIILHSNVFVKPLIVFLSYSESNRTTHLAHSSSLTTIISSNFTQTEGDTGTLSVWDPTRTPPGGVVVNLLI